MRIIFGTWPSSQRMGTWSGGRTPMATLSRGPSVLDSDSYFSAESNFLFAIGRILRIQILESSIKTMF
jgi:hypothetical protein